MWRIQYDIAGAAQERTLGRGASHRRHSLDRSIVFITSERIMQQNDNSMHAMSMVTKRDTKAKPTRDAKCLYNDRQSLTGCTDCGNCIHPEKKTNSTCYVTITLRIDTTFSYAKMHGLDSVLWQVEYGLNTADRIWRSLPLSAYMYIHWIPSVGI